MPYKSGWRNAGGLQLPDEHAMANVSDLVRLLRPKQWVKNMFVCAGVLFGGQWHNPKSLLAVALTFGAFSLMGSCVYVINDYLDRDSDKDHPTKRDRPLVSGAVTAQPPPFVSASRS